MAHLTVEQTIHDIARLIEVVRSDLNSTNSTVILFGTGYGASLATWTKQRFPHLVHGVWSSSGVYETTVHTAGKNLAINLLISRKSDNAKKIGKVQNIIIEKSIISEFPVTFLCYSTVRTYQSGYCRNRWSTMFEPITSCIPTNGGVHFCR